MFKSSFLPEYSISYKLRNHSVSARFLPKLLCGCCIKASRIHVECNIEPTHSCSTARSDPTNADY